MIKTQKLSEVAEFVNGGAWSQDAYSEKGVPVVRVSDIADGEIDLSQCKYLKEELSEKYKKHTLTEGDLIVCTVGSHPTQPGSVVGRTAVVSKEIDGAYLNQNAVLIRAKDRTNQEWLGFLGSSPEFHDYIKAHARGSASQVRMSISALKNLPVPLLPLEYQEKSSDILSTYRSLIRNNRKRIEILEEIAQAIYTEWFVNFGGKIPSGWKVAQIGDQIKIPKGKNITRKTLKDGEVPVVAGGLKPAYHHADANTKNPVVTISASGANSGFVNLYLEDVWASDCSYIDLSVTPYVYFYYLLLKTRQHEVTHLQRGSAQPHVYPKDIMNLEMVVPPEDMVSEFCDLVAPSFDLIRNLRLQVNNLTKTRDLLIPKLVTGEVEIKA